MVIHSPAQDQALLTVAGPKPLSSPGSATVTKPLAHLPSRNRVLSSSFQISSNLTRISNIECFWSPYHHGRSVVSCEHGFQLVSISIQLQGTVTQQRHLISEQQILTVNGLYFDSYDRTGGLHKCSSIFCSIELGHPHI